MTRHEREAAERFELLVAHPYGATVAFYLADAARAKGSTPWGKGLLELAMEIVAARARGRA